MNSKEIAEMIERLVDRTLFDLGEVPSSILKRLKTEVEREFDKRKDEPKVKLITVGANGNIDKCFLMEDKELADKYAIKSLESQLHIGNARVSMSYEVIKQSDVERYLLMVGEYE